MFENVNCPVASVVAVRSSPLIALVKWIDAPGMTAPLGSVTVPRTVPALPPCADTPGSASRMTRAERKERNVPRMNGMGCLLKMAVMREGNRGRCVPRSSVRSRHHSVCCEGIWGCTGDSPGRSGRSRMNRPKLETEGRLAAGRRRADEELRVPIAGNLAHFEDRSGRRNFDQRDGWGRGGDGRGGVHDDAERTMIGVGGDCMFVRHLCHG